MNTVALYTVTHIASGKRYVGISKLPVRRWKEHKAEARSGSDFHFHRALRKYGADAFVFEIVGGFPSPALAKFAERSLIRFTKPEYNSTAGGDGPMYGKKHTEESKQKMGETRRGKPLKPWSDEAKAAFRLVKQAGVARRAAENPQPPKQKVSRRKPPREKKPILPKPAARVSPWRSPYHVLLQDSPQLKDLPAPVRRARVEIPE